VRGGGDKYVKNIMRDRTKFSCQGERDPNIWAQFMTIYKYVSIFGKLFAVIVVAASFAL